MVQGSCQCLPNVEGTLCNRCKPLYWNLAAENPRGCVGECNEDDVHLNVQEVSRRSGCFLWEWAAY